MRKKKRKVNGKGREGEQIFIIEFEVHGPDGSLETAYYLR